ncbi:unnamed protein product [Bursaphelenchus okinawaensis]|uniref:Uncharacterized protein n=1 Tax=Bursaphelenchus okinawaensis TaxID=465554 RepID=A0A811KBE4_9BILA|nr:unnamed protein product [Bursaphelenchus okinawaensis]CAG9100893.1 unnamed protein product [Bursaphelenchus okinawaensis]
MFKLALIAAVCVVGAQGCNLKGNTNATITIGVTLEDDSQYLVADRKNGFKVADNPLEIGIPTKAFKELQTMTQDSSNLETFFNNNNIYFSVKTPEYSSHEINRVGQFELKIVDGKEWVLGQQFLFRVCDDVFDGDYTVNRDDWVVTSSSPL